MKSSVLPLLLLLFVGIVSAADDKPADKPAPKLPLGKETTYVTGPLDKQGYIDYESALNAELGRGITHEKNANVALWMAFGPTPEGSIMPPDYFRWLDMPAPPKEGEYIIGLGKYARERLALTDNQLEAVFETLSRTTQRPWEAKDCAPIAEWLKINEKPLELVVEATKLPEYFNPLVSRHKDGEPSSLISALLPSVQKCRELATALTGRAMLLVQEGKFDDAWQDILACHRLARLISRGGTLIEGLVAIAIGQIAANSTVAYLENAKLTSKEAMARLKDLRSLPPFASSADKIDFLERFMGLEALQNTRRVGIGYIDALEEGTNRKATPEEEKALEKVDWVPAMRNMNQCYDRIAAAMRLKDRAAREKEFDQIDKDLQARRKDAGDIEKLSGRLLAKDGPDKNTGTAISEMLMGLLTPAVRKVQGAYDRAAQVEQNLHTAFALAAYRADHGSYPAKLEDLAPKYLAAVPGDLFSGKALIYKPKENGYLFYSVGANGKDDGGQTFGDDPPGDDLGVRMPLPPLKKN
jgi:hypothetical protein